MQLGCITKAATVAAFNGCEPDWTNLEPLYGRFETFSGFSSLKMTAFYTTNLG